MKSPKKTIISVIGASTMIGAVSIAAVAQACTNDVNENIGYLQNLFSLHSGNRNLDEGVYTPLTSSILNWANQQSNYSNLGRVAIYINNSAEMVSVKSAGFGAYTATIQQSQVYVLGREGGKFAV